MSSRVMPRPAFTTRSPRFGTLWTVSDRTEDVDRPFVLAMVAHDGKKDDIVRLAKDHLETLRSVRLFATATTGSLLASQVGLNVECMVSGPQGGDLQIGARIVQGEIDAVVFLRDPLTAHPHDTDIQAFLKVCDVHDVPLATNRASAEVLLRSLAESQVTSG